MRVLLVEDDADLARAMRRVLALAGYDVVTADTLHLARERLAAGALDFLLLDRTLPDGDGLDLLRELRRTGDATPAIVLTALQGVDDRVAGLTTGADDYMAKPAAIDELLARIAAVCRRVGMSGLLEIADLRIDPEARKVSRAGVEIALTGREYDLLVALARHRGRVLSRARLLELVWGTQEDRGTNTVDAAVSYLRAKIDKGFTPPMIHSVRGVGYLLDPTRR